MYGANPFVIPESSIERVEAIKAILVARATGEGGGDDEQVYHRLRLALLSEPSLVSVLPSWLKTHRSLGEFWGFIKPKFATYRERREFLREQFCPALELLESSKAVPVDKGLSDIIEKFDAEHVLAAWQRATERRERDPEGAITSARTLLEAVCKYILAEFGQSDFGEDDLPALYHKASVVLNLAPSQHTEDVFKRLLGSCAQVVNTLGTLRNRLGDAHGAAPRAVKPAPRHARLAVNMAGSMATFLIETFEARKTSASSN